MDEIVREEREFKEKYEGGLSRIYLLAGRVLGVNLKWENARKMFLGPTESKEGIELGNVRLGQKWGPFWGEF